MNAVDWIGALVTELGRRNVAVEERPACGLAPVRLIQVSAEHWSVLAHAARSADARWVAGFGEDAGEDIVINACFEQAGRYLLRIT